MRIHIHAHIISFICFTILQLSACAFPQFLHQINIEQTVEKQYQLETAEQQNAFKNILNIASIQHPLLNATKNTIVKNILNFIQETQNKFTIRTANQERWEVNAPAWITENQDALFENMQILNVIKTIFPEKKETDMLCILGATRASMETRLNDAFYFLQEQYCHTKSLMLLTGERNPTLNQGSKRLDGTEEELNQIAKLYDLPNWKHITEEYLMRHSFKTSSLNQFLQPFPIALYSLNAPKQENNPRATTQDTIVTLLDWIQRPTEYSEYLDYFSGTIPTIKIQKIHHIIFISNQPYVLYQQAIIESVFHATRSPITFEVIGKNSYANKDQLLTIIGSLGSFLWATTPALLAALDIQTTDPETIDLCKKLYGKVDSLYKRLPSILRGEHS